MIKKLSYYVGKFLSLAIIVLLISGGLALLKIAAYLLKWVFYGTFII